MKYCVIYGRVSTSAENQKTSIEEQTAIDESSIYNSWLSFNNYKVLATFSDIKSGTTDEREGFQDLLHFFGIERKEIQIKGSLETPEEKYIYSFRKATEEQKAEIGIKENITYAKYLSLKGCNYILTKNTSRINRTGDTSIIERLKRENIYFYFIDQGQDSKTMESLTLNIFSQLDKDKSIDNSRKVKIGLEQSIKRNRIRTNKNIYGFKLIERTSTESAKLIPIEDEAKVVKLIFNLYINKDFGTRKIVNELIQRGIKTRKNENFSASTIKRILGNEKYAGYNNIEKKWESGEVFFKHSPKKLYDYKIEKCEHITPIITIDTFLKAQEITKKRSDENSRRGRKIAHSDLYGKTFCGKCGALLVNNQYNNVKVMICGNKRKNQNCNLKNIKVSEIDNAIEKICNNFSDFWKCEKESLISDYLYALNTFGLLILHIETNSKEDYDKKLLQITNEINKIDLKIDSEILGAEEFYNDKKKMLLAEYKKISDLKNNLDTLKKSIESDIYSIYNMLDLINSFNSKNIISREEFLSLDIIIKIFDNNKINIQMGRKLFNEIITKNQMNDIVNTSLKSKDLININKMLKMIYQRYKPKEELYL